jgi:hypothetical protein
MTQLLDPQEMIKRQLEIMRLMEENPDRYEEQSDQPISDQDIRENLGAVRSDMSPQDIIEEAMKQGVREQATPYQMGERSSIPRSPDPVFDSYKYGDTRRGQEGIDERGRGGQFLHGSERIPLSLFKPPAGRSYLDEDRGAILQPKLGPGMRMREGQYNPNLDEVKEFLRKQLEGFKGY